MPPDFPVFHGENVWHRLSEYDRNIYGVENLTPYGVKYVVID